MESAERDEVKVGSKTEADECMRGRDLIGESRKNDILVRKRRENVEVKENLREIWGRKHRKKGKDTKRARLKRLTGRTAVVEKGGE